MRVERRAPAPRVRPQTQVVPSPAPVGAPVGVDVGGQDGGRAERGHQPRSILSPTGNDDSPGTQAAPLRSVERAAKLARPARRSSSETAPTPGRSPPASTAPHDGADLLRVPPTAAAPRSSAMAHGTLPGRTTVTTSTSSGSTSPGSNVDGLLSGGSFVRLIDNNVHGFHAGNCITTANRRTMTCTTSTSSATSRPTAAQTSWITASTSATRNGIVANNIAYGNAGYRHPLLAQLQRAGHLEQPGFRQRPGRHRDRPGRRAEQRRESPPTTSSYRTTSPMNNGRDGIRESGATGSNNQFLNNILWNNGTKRINLKTDSKSGDPHGRPAVRQLPDGRIR